MIKRWKSIDENEVIPVFATFKRAASHLEKIRAENPKWSNRDVKAAGILAQVGRGQYAQEWREILASKS